MKTHLIASMAAFLVVMGAFAETVLFKDVRNAEVKAHVDGKVARPTDGTALTIGEQGAELACNFTTVGHDAAWFEFPCELSVCTEIVLERTTSDNRQQLYVVLTDKNGENHLFRFSTPGNARQRAKATVREKNQYPGEYFAWRWGGDDNQKIDWPVRKVAFGVNDTPDTFVGRVNVVFHSFETK